MGWQQVCYQARRGVHQDIWITGPDTYWGVGVFGNVDGLNAGVTGTSNSLWAIWRNISTRDTWVAGDWGSILYRDGRTIP